MANFLKIDDVTINLDRVLFIQKRLKGDSYKHPFALDFLFSTSEEAQGDALSFCFETEDELDEILTLIPASSLGRN